MKNCFLFFCSVALSPPLCLYLYLCRSHFVVSSVSRRLSDQLQQKTTSANCVSATYNSHYLGVGISERGGSWQ
uniref:Putative secreted protein n=1 Tax=Anopheles triannulatus TaxID=58253 RepID=A0A2M4B6Y7_9DIPT